MINKQIFVSSKGFTLAELLVIIFILSLIIGAIYSGHSLSYKSYREGEKVAEITQNGRVILERMTREIRQAREVVTELSEEESEATSTIEFEDGHVSEDYHYIRYFKEDDKIKREVVGYYFSGDPGTLVPWDSNPPIGQTLEATTSEEAKIIGEKVNDLNFWGPRLINIALILEKENKVLNLKTKVFGRNF